MNRSASQSPIAAERGRNPNSAGEREGTGDNDPPSGFVTLALPRVSIPFISSSL